MRTPEIARIFIGYDPRESVAYHVCSQSLIEHSSIPLQITPLALPNIAGLYAETHTDGSNAFIYSRFLIPWLCGWQGPALYLDGDMIVRSDIAELWALRRLDVGVQVVKHDYKTKHPVKYLGARNEDYPGKNWSSVILWNCGYSPHRCLTPDFVSKATGSYLHRFEWLLPEKVGDLPRSWNHLVGEYGKADCDLAHYTIGTPCFPGYEAQEYGVEWYDCLTNLMAPLPITGSTHGA